MSRRHYDINFFRNLAIEKGGLCLSKEFITLRNKLEWKCEDGHFFKLEPSKIISRNYWCDECTGRRGKHTIESISNIAKKRGWLFLSENYTNGSEKYKFQCDKGHIIYAIAHNVIKGAGCRTCAGKQLLTIDIFKQIAINRGGECLSEQYNGQRNKLKFRCKEGHIFETLPGEIKNSGAWCKKCAGLELGTIEEMISLAKSNGGECLSKKYINSSTKLKWKCADNHIWEAPPRDVKHSKSWCPYCTWYTGERKCKHILERLLNTEFRKTRKVLQNGLELDGYSKELNLAFEHNGIQHYEKSYFSGSMEKLQKIKIRDQKKIEQCKSKGIHLIIIPYNAYEDDRQLIELLKNELIIRDINFIDLEPEYLMKDFYFSNSSLEDIKNLAAANGSVLLSVKDKSGQHKIELKCENGHFWETTHGSLKNGKSCPQCAGFVRITIEDLHEIAKLRNGKCLSETIINNSTPVKWECEKGHTWNASPASVKNAGTWCLICAGKARLTIEDMKKIAFTRNGKCLSQEYINNSTNLLWECHKGHQWQARPQDVKNKKSWCPHCAKLKSEKGGT